MHYVLFQCYQSIAMCSARAFVEIFSDAIVVLLLLLLVVVMAVVVVLLLLLLYSCAELLLPLLPLLDYVQNSTYIASRSDTANT